MIMYSLLRLLFLPEMALKVSRGVVVASRGTFRSSLPRDIEDICRRTGLQAGIVLVTRSARGRKIRVFGPLRSARQQIRNAVSI